MNRSAPLLAALVLVAAGCSNDAPDSGSAAAGEGGGGGSLQGDVLVTGSSTITPIMSEIARRFESEHPGVRIDVQAGGSSRGIADARNGLSDFGMASRALTPAEKKALTPHTIARDGVGMIVHSENPVSGLNDEQVAGIYTGRIQNWSEVGGADAPITLVNKAEGRATLEVFLDQFGLKNQQIPADVVVGHNEQDIQTVAGNPGAIGYVSIGTAETDIAQGLSIKLLPLDGVEASTRAVASGEYPMARPLNLVAAPELSEPARALIEYAQSPAVHDIIRDLGFVPVE